MPKKRPSQRAERKLDETARAIARSREQEKPEKPPVEIATENKSKSGRLTKATVAQREVSPISKRQKKG